MQNAYTQLTDYLDTSAGATIDFSSMNEFSITQSLAEQTASGFFGVHVVALSVDLGVYPAGFTDAVHPVLAVWDSTDTGMATNGCCFEGAVPGSQLVNAADVIPEPASLVLLGVGAAGIGMVVRRRRA